MLAALQHVHTGAEGKDSTRTQPSEAKKVTSPTSLLSAHFDMEM